jgi:hypothetical protein
MSDKQPPHTLAIELEPCDSVINDSVRIVYGKSSIEGRVGINARSAKFPCPVKFKESTREYISTNTNSSRQTHRANDTRNVQYAPTSRRPGAPVRPVSPTQLGGNVYCR